MTNENLNLASLFVFRFATDRHNDVVNLEQDVLDLHFYPERLLGSYRQEWMTYVKKRAHELDYELSSEFAEHLLSKMPENKKKEFYKLWKIIEKTEQISSSNNVDVIKTDVKAYVEQLLKL